MSYDIQFVDQVSASAAVRLNLMMAPWTVRVGTEFPPPELRRSVAGTLLTNGEQYPAAAYGNRLVRLVLRIDAASDDDAIAALQSLYRELDRPTNVLRYRPNTSQPVFFRTFRAGPDDLIWDPVQKEVRVSIPAEPFAYGLKETLPAVTVYSDPVEGTTLNANPFFETDALNWSALGGTAVRSTAQFHEGVASLLLTPDGVSASAEARSAAVPVTVGQQYRASAWVRCAAARSVNVGVIWRDAANAFVGSSLIPLSVAANTWTLIEGTHTAPAGATQAQLVATIGSTPLASHLLHIDEARIRQVGSQGAMYFDVSGVRGDVETPLHLRLSPSPVLRQVLMAVRRRGNPAAAPFVLQAEAMGAGGTDTALGAANDAAMSGSGQNYLRTTFATDATMVSRTSISLWPAVASPDVRGGYRVFARVRRSVGGDAISLQLAWGNNVANVSGDVVALPSAAITAPIYVDLGLVQFPTGWDPVAEVTSGVPLSMAGMYFELRAQRKTGTGNLDWDFLAFVPADDRLMIAQINPDSGGAAQILDAGQGQVYGVGSSGEVRPSVAAQLAGGPPEVSPGVTNRVVYMPNILQTSVGDVITDSTQVTPYYFPRYLHARPLAS